MKTVHQGRVGLRVRGFDGRLRIRISVGLGWGQ